MTETLDDSSFASDPGRIALRHEKMSRLHPELYLYKGLCNRLKKRFTPQQLYWHTYHREHLENGDSRAAVVISLQPLVIAAYTDEFDCVAMLQFPDFLVSEYALAVGSRLLTVNTYYQGHSNLVADLEHGSASFYRYWNFTPFIAEFLSIDFDRIEQRKSEISDEEWARTLELAHAYLAQHGSQFRNGLPLYCSIPAIGPIPSGLN
jgi:hypothetical protein